MNKSTKITIFTPTYNRGYILGELYKSLLIQIDKSFEWVIVDDGSSDNTYELVSRWKEKDNGFDIIYEKVVNGGKHRAINRGVDIANGELFFIVDSDDKLTDDAVFKIKKWQSEIQNDHNFAGIAGLRGINKNKAIGETFVGNYIDATALQREKYNIKGDKAEIYYTDVLRENKFPTFDNENFITESVVWYEIANKGLKLRWYNEVIYLCEYRDDGLTSQGMNLFYNNPKGALYAYKNEKKYKQFSLKRRIYAINKYIQVAEKSNISYKHMAKDLKINAFLLKFIRFIYRIKERG